MVANRYRVRDANEHFGLPVMFVLFLCFNKINVEIVSYYSPTVS